MEKSTISMFTVTVARKLLVLVMLLPHRTASQTEPPAERRFHVSPGSFSPPVFAITQDSDFLSCLWCLGSVFNTGSQPEWC